MKRKKILAGISVCLICLSSNNLIFSECNEQSNSQESIISSVYDKTIPSLKMTDSSYIATKDYNSIKDIENWDLYGKTVYHSAKELYDDIGCPLVTYEYIGSRRLNTVIEALARCIYAECDYKKTSEKSNNGEDGRYAISWIILNRKDSGDMSWVDPGVDLAFKNIVFSTNGGIQFEAMHETKYGTNPLVLKPDITSLAWKQSLRIAWNMVNGQGRNLSINPNPIKSPYKDDDSFYAVKNVKNVKAFTLAHFDAEPIGGNYFFKYKRPKSK